MLPRNPVLKSTIFPPDFDIHGHINATEMIFTDIIIMIIIIRAKASSVLVMSVKIMCISADCGANFLTLACTSSHQL